MPIDYVIPFVDCSDGNWLLEYKKYVSDTRDWSNDDTRFRDWETLRYQLLSLLKVIVIVLWPNGVECRVVFNIVLNLQTQHVKSNN